MDSEELRKKALAFAQEIRGLGIHCEIDQYYEVKPPEEGWTKWMESQIRNADYVLVVCTEGYYDKVTMSVKSGRGVKWESKIIYNEMYQNHSLNGKFIPISFGPWSLTQVPPPLQDTTVYDVEDKTMYDRLIYRLHSHEPVIPREIGNKPDFKKPVLDTIQQLFEKNYEGRIKSLAESSSTSVGIVVSEFFEDLCLAIREITRVPDDGTNKSIYESVLHHADTLLEATDLVEQIFHTLARNSSADGLQSAYEGFGKIHLLYGNWGHPSVTTFKKYEFEAFQLCGYFWAVCMFGSLVKYERWDIISELLKQNIFIEEPNSPAYIQFKRINSYCYVFEQLGGAGTTGAIAMERVGNLKTLSDKEFRAGDMFLYLYSNLNNIQRDREPSNVWGAQDKRYESPDYLCFL